MKRTNSDNNDKSNDKANDKFNFDSKLYKIYNKGDEKKQKLCNNNNNDKEEEKQWYLANDELVVLPANYVYFDCKDRYLTMHAKEAYIAKDNISNDKMYGHYEKIKGKRNFLLTGYSINKRLYDNLMIKKTAKEKKAASLYFNKQTKQIQMAKTILTKENFTLCYISSELKFDTVDKVVDELWGKIVDGYKNCRFSQNSVECNKSFEDRLQIARRKCCTQYERKAVKYAFISKIQTYFDDDPNFDMKAELDKLMKKWIEMEDNKHFLQEYDTRLKNCFMELKSMKYKRLLLEQFKKEFSELTSDEITTVLKQDFASYIIHPLFDMKRMKEKLRVYCEQKEANAKIFEYFPLLDEKTAKEIIERCWTSGVGFHNATLDIETKIYFAVEAHVRYNHTNFAKLKQNITYTSAWTQVIPEIIKVMLRFILCDAWLEDDNNNLISKEANQNVSYLLKKQSVVIGENKKMFLPLEIVKMIMKQKKLITDAKVNMIKKKIESMIAFSIQENEKQAIAFRRTFDYDSDEYNNSENSGYDYDSVDFSGDDIDDEEEVDEQDDDDDDDDEQSD